MKLPGHGRYAHSAIPLRPTYEWPNGTRLALVVCNNIEAFAYRAGLGSDSTGAAAPQGQRNYAWRDYGNRVGLWNMLDMLDELEIPCAHNVNGLVLDACPEIAPALIPLREALMVMTGRPVNIQASRDIVISLRGGLLDQPYLTLIERDAPA